MLVLQAETSAEVRTALLVATMRGMPVRRVSLKELQSNLDVRASLAAYLGEILPVGTVEFVRTVMGIRGVPEPEGMGYGPVGDFLRREIREGVLYELKAAEGPVFVKPVATKTFSGFVYDPRPGAKHTEYQLEQLKAIASLKTATRVWLSEVVEFACEWRYYVDATGRILAKARYDADGDDDAPEPTAEVVQSAIDSTVTYLEARGNAHPFAIDVGVLTNRRTAVVELSDAWLLASTPTPARRPARTGRPMTTSTFCCSAGARSSLTGSFVRPGRLPTVWPRPRRSSPRRRRFLRVAAARGRSPSRLPRRQQ